MSVTVDDLVVYPGMGEDMRPILEINLEAAFCANSAIDPNNPCFQLAITYYALALTQWMCLAPFKAGGVTTSMSRGMGANASAGFNPPPDDLYGWQSTIYGQLYMELIRRKLGSGARVIKRGPNQCLPYPT